MWSECARGPLECLIFEGSGEPIRRTRRRSRRSELSPVSKSDVLKQVSKICRERDTGLEDVATCPRPFRSASAGRVLTMERVPPQGRKYIQVRVGFGKKKSGNRVSRLCCSRVDDRLAQSCVGTIDRGHIIGERLCRVVESLVGESQIRGVSLTDLDALNEQYGEGYDGERVLLNALNTWTLSVIGCDFFHADVHAGAL